MWSRYGEVVRNALCAPDKGHAELALANAHFFLELTGHVVVAWIWLRQALVAVKKVGTDAGSEQGVPRGRPV